MRIAWVDFETRSRCDLKTKGVYNYAQDASTDVLCMAYAFDDEDVQLWLPGQPLPDFTGCQIRARNATFERLIFWYVLQQDYPLEAFYCTAAQAAANCLPRSLEDTGRAISSKMRKDYRGSQLIRLLSIPQADGSFNTDPTLMREMYEYCLQDVRTDREISKALRDLTAQELEDYHVNERINDRGLLIDTVVCLSATRYSDAELVEAQAVFTEITGLPSVRSPKMKQWVQERVGERALELMVVYKDGKKKTSADSSVRASLLLLAEESPDEVSPDVVEVLQCADDVWASSVGKFKRLAALADVEDRRARGGFVFAGGAATGRYASYGIQFHNLPRKCAADPEAVRLDMLRGRELAPLYGKRVSDVLKSMLRPAIKAPNGHKLISLDWSGIEARVTPWITGDDRAEASLDVFRSGKDVYVTTAAAMFNKSEAEVTKADRMLGKVAVLACGFGGSIGAFASMGRIYGVTLPEAEAKRMVNLWRRTNPWAQPFWYGLEEAYTRAMRNKGNEFTAGRVTYLFDGRHLWYMLPSGRILCYPYAKLDSDGVSYLKAAWKPKADAKAWPRGRLWHGLAAENIVQATANCLLRDSLRKMDAEGIYVIGSVHDEIIAECPTNLAEGIKSRMEEIMSTPPAWAKGLPLETEGAIMDRFSK